MTVTISLFLVLTKYLPGFTLLTKKSKYEHIQNKLLVHVSLYMQNYWPVLNFGIIYSYVAKNKMFCFFSIFFFQMKTLYSNLIM